MRKHKGLPFAPLVAAMAFFLGFESGGFQLALLRVATEFGMNKSEMGTLAGLQFLAMSAFPLLAGGLSARLGKKRLLLYTMPLFVVGCAVAALAQGPAALIAGVLLLGLGFSSSETVAMAALTDSNPEKASRTANLVQSLFSLGAVAGPLLSNLLFEKGASWRVVFEISGAGYLLLTLMVTGAVIPASAQAEDGEEKSRGLRALFTPTLLLMAAAILLYVGTESGIAFFIDSFFKLELNAAQQGAYGIAAFWFAMAVARALFAMVHTNPRRVVTAGFALMAALTLCMFLAHSTGLMLALCATAGFLCGPLWPMLAAMGMNACPQDTGTAMGLLSATGSVGGALLPALMGVCADAWGVRQAFLPLCLSALAGMFLLCVGGRIKGRPTRRA